MERARKMYAVGLTAQEERAKKMLAPGEDPYTRRPIVAPDGPHVEIGINVPIFPCVLVVQNSYGIGPLWGK